jgi:hypothetical protein
METASIVSSLVSLVLGIYAIWLSIMFYRMSTDSSSKIQESAKDLGASVNRLEKLFDRLYADTFSMMRDTVSDMRKHIWPDNPQEEQEAIKEVQRRADEKAAEIQDELTRQVSALTEKVGGTDARIKQLRDELVPVMGRAINRSRHAESEAREETLRGRLIGVLATKGTAPFMDIYRELGGFRPGDVMNELFQLNKDGLANWPSAPDAPLPLDREPISFNASSVGRSPNSGDRAK